MVPTSPAPPSATVARPELPVLASAIHHAAGDDIGLQLIHVQYDEPPDAEPEVALGFWPMPTQTVHPIDPLVGFVAPAQWAAIGIVSTGRIRSIDPDVGTDSQVERTIATVLLGRDGAAASVFDGLDGQAQTSDAWPIGLVADALARTLGLPTPPPEHTVGHLVNLQWLDRVAAGLLHRPSHGRSWRWLADRHPLRGPGGPPTPEELARRVAWGSREWSWPRALASLPEGERPTTDLAPPGGHVIAIEDWFDEGAISRWMLRNLPPAEALLPDLLAVLPPDLGEQLVVALGEDLS